MISKTKGGTADIRPFRKMSVDFKTYKRDSILKLSFSVHKDDNLQTGLQIILKEYTMKELEKNYNPADIEDRK